MVSTIAGAGTRSRVQERPLRGAKPELELVYLAVRSVLPTELTLAANARADREWGRLGSAQDAGEGRPCVP